MSFSPGPTLVPRYFALVMATGIVSIACHQLGLRSAAWVLFRFNQAAYAVLWIAMLVRLGRPRVVIARLRRDVLDPRVSGGHVLGCHAATGRN